MPIRTMLLASLLLLSGCGLGVCLGTDGLFGNTYCYSDFSKSECDDYADEGVNDASWEFYGGETCDDMGYLEGSN